MQRIEALAIVGKDAPSVLKWRTAVNTAISWIVVEWSTWFVQPNSRFFKCHLKLEANPGQARKAYFGSVALTEQSLFSWHLPFRI